MESNLNSSNKRSANDASDTQDNNNNNNVKRTRSSKVDLRFLLASRMNGSLTNSMFLILFKFR